MNTTAKILAITIVFALPLLFISTNNFNESNAQIIAGNPAPLIVLSGFESIAFGLGIAFAVFAWPHLKNSSLPKNVAKTMFVSVSWILLSWWPYNNIFSQSATDPIKAFFAERVYFLSIIISSIILIYSLFIVIKQKTESIQLPAKEEHLMEKILGIKD